MKRSAT
jgi:hypothetical protein